MDLGWVNFDLYDPSSCPVPQQQNEEGSGMPQIKYQPTTSVKCSDIVKRDYILSFSKGRTVDLKTLTLIEEPAPAAAATTGNGNAEPNADELDNAEEEFEKLLKESGD